MGTHEQVIIMGVQLMTLSNVFLPNEARSVVIFITNHSHDTSGDLFVSPGSCATVTEVSESRPL